MCFKRGDLKAFYLFQIYVSVFVYLVMNEQKYLPNICSLQFLYIV